MLPETFPHYTDKIADIFNTRVRSVVKRDERAECILSGIRSVLEDMHAIILDIKMNNSTYAADEDYLHDIANTFGIASYGLPSEWIMRLIKAKLMQRFYNGKLFGNTGLIEAIQYLTNGIYIEHVHTGGSSCTLYVFTTYTLTTELVSAFRDICRGYNISAKNINVFISNRDSVATAEEPIYDLTGLPYSGNIAYKIL